MIKDKLTQLGLTEKESLLYVYLLDNYKAKASELAKYLEVTHPAVKKMIDSLLEKKLIKAQSFGKSTLYFLEESEKIVDFVNRRVEEKREEMRHQLNLAEDLSHLIEDTHLLKKDSDTSLRFYKGSEGLREFVDIASSAKDEVILEFFDLDLAMYTKTKQKAKQKNLYRERGKKFDTIYTSKDKKHESDLLVDLVKMNKEDFLFPSADMLLFDDKVAFLFTTDKKNVLVIQNQWIHNTLKTLFLNLKKHLKK